MTNWNRIKHDNAIASENILAEIYGWQADLNNMATESDRLSQVAKHSDTIIENLDVRFEQATKLKGIDNSFLLVATALQCIRQYVIGTITQRTDDKSAAKNTKGHGKESSDRRHKLYNPALDEIISNPVPFDAIYGGKDFDLGIGGGFTHRAKTIGHDPLLGWIFGTMNIATSTVTVSEGFQSYHVLTGRIANGATRDKISKRADTVKILDYSKKKLVDEGTKGKEKIAISLMKEAIHLKSDIYSTASLPIPIISTISVEAARKLADYGLDMGNVVKVGEQAGYAILVNSLIGMLHGLFYDESEYSSWSLYSVKTRKILSYSNMIASTSNVIAAALAAAIGIRTENPELIKKSLKYLDIGGIIVTIYRVVTDRQFIYEIKREFLEQEWYNLVTGEY